MSKNQLRPIVVDNEAYLWVLRNYQDIWAGTLMVYSAQSKAGRLEVHYDSDEYFAWSSGMLRIVDEENPSRYLNIHEPEPTSRIIRYARLKLRWNPTENKEPLIIEHGFDVLKLLGYKTEPKADKPAVSPSLDELKNLVTAVEAHLDNEVFVELHTLERNQRKLTVALTKQLRNQAMRGKVWKSKAFLTALKNAEYGFDETIARSLSGRDGIFLLDRNFRPPNAMMHKLFDQFIDKPESGIKQIVEKLGANVQDLKPVRLVSHHLRLLGLLLRTEEKDVLVLVDYDQS